MKKVLWAVLAVLLLVSCGKAVTAEPEKPLELTAKNIEGKWVLEGDSSVWYEFKTDGTVSVGKSGASKTRYYKINADVVQLYTNPEKTIAGDALRIRLFKQYCFISINNTPEKQYNKN